VIDIGRLFNSPGGQTDVPIGFPQAVEIGAVDVMLSFDGARFEVEDPAIDPNACRFSDSLDFEVQTKLVLTFQPAFGQVSIHLEPVAGETTVQLPSGELVVCAVRVAQNAEAATFCVADEQCEFPFDLCDEANSACVYLVELTGQIVDQEGIIQVGPGFGMVLLQCSNDEQCAPNVCDFGTFTCVTPTPTQ
jgi:hypothetical protein